MRRLHAMGLLLYRLKIEFPRFLRSDPACKIGKFQPSRFRSPKLPIYQFTTLPTSQAPNLPLFHPSTLPLPLAPLTPLVPLAPFPNKTVIKIAKLGLADLGGKLV
jgi:hypothetical protein